MLDRTRPLTGNETAEKDLSRQLQEYDLQQVEDFDDPSNAPDEDDADPDWPEDPVDVANWDDDDLEFVYMRYLPAPNTHFRRLMKKIA